MLEIFSRNEMFWGDEIQHKLKSACVAIFGLGGVGGFACEMLARAGIGSIVLIDFDTVSESNINRQLVALHSTVGKLKTILFEQRLKDINPNVKLKTLSEFYSDKFDFSNVDYVVDAIDTMKSKIQLLEECYLRKIPVVSSFGAGNRLDPTKLYACDISEIKDKKAPFVHNLLYQLEKRGISQGIDVVLSEEKPIKPVKIIANEVITTNDGENIEFNKIIPSSTPFVASAAGIIMASIIVKKIMVKKNG